MAGSSVWMNLPYPPSWERRNDVTALGNGKLRKLSCVRIGPADRNLYPSFCVHINVTVQTPVELLHINYYLHITTRILLDIDDGLRRLFHRDGLGEDLLYIYLSGVDQLNDFLEG